LPRCDAT